MYIKKKNVFLIFVIQVLGKSQSIFCSKLCIFDVCQDVCLSLYANFDQIEFKKKYNYFCY